MSKMPRDDGFEALPLSRIVVVSKVPKKGLRLKITLSEQEETDLMQYCDLGGIGSFEADLFLEKVTTAKLRLTGTVRANVTQSCVLSLQPVHTRVDEDIDLLLVPCDMIERFTEKLDEEGALVMSVDEDIPDTYANDQVDLGAFALEHFALGLDSYPQAKTAVFEGQADAPEVTDSPFSGLAALKDKLKPN